MMLSAIAVWLAALPLLAVLARPPGCDHDCPRASERVLPSVSRSPPSVTTFSPSFKPSADSRAIVGRRSQLHQSDVRRRYPHRRHTRSRLSAHGESHSPARRARRARCRAAAARSRTRSGTARRPCYRSAPCARTVPVCVSIWLSSVRNVPAPRFFVRVRSSTVVGSLGARVHPLLHGCHSIRRQREHHIDRRHLRDRRDATRIARRHVVADVDGSQADTPADRAPAPCCSRDSGAQWRPQRDPLRPCPEAASPLRPAYRRPAARSSPVRAASCSDRG